MLVEKIQLRADSVRKDDQEVFHTLREMGVYGQYDPEHSDVGKTAFILVSKSGWEEPPAELGEDQVTKLKALDAVEDVILVS